MQRFGNTAISLILAIITLILCALKVNDGQYIMGDGAGYIAQAIALAQGATAQYISENTLMMTKCDWIFGPTAYPWGYPMLLAIAYKIFGFNIIAFKSVGIICYGLFVGIFYMFCANRLPKIYAIFATLLFVLNPFLTFSSANSIVSDIPFLLFGFCALIVLAKLFGKSTQMGGGKIYAIVGGILMLFASLIRINGFVILCALIAIHGILLANRFAPNLFKTKILQPLSRIDSPYSWKIHAIPYVIFIVGFVIISITLSSGGSGHFGELSRKLNSHSILWNLYEFIIALGKVGFNFFFELNTMEFVAFAICLLPFIALGVARCLKGDKCSENVFFMIFALGFCALLVLWIARGLRFVALLLPFLIFWCANGIKGKLISYVVGVVLVVFLVIFGYLGIVDMEFKNKDGRLDELHSISFNTEPTKQIWDFITQNTPKNAIIISAKPRGVYLYTHRLGFATRKIERFSEADFVLWWAVEYDGHGLPNIISKEFRDRTRLVFENTDYKLFKILK